MSWCVHVYRAFLILPLMLASLGCGGNVQDYGVRFPATEIDVDGVEGEDLVREFPFEVVGKIGVTITKLRSTCQCTAASSPDLGRVLAPGEKGVVRVTLSPENRTGKLRGTVFVDTEPLSPVSIVLNLNATLPGRPAVVGAFPVPVSATLGQELDVLFDVATDRVQGEDVLQVDLAQSKLDGFSIDREELIESPVNAGGAQLESTIHEIHRFQLKHGPFNELGSRVEQLQISWQGGQLKTPVALAITVSHPLEVRPANAFVGYLSPNQSKTMSFSFVNPVQGDDLMFVAEGDADDAELKYDPEKNHIELKFVAPATRGRFLKKWVVRSSTPMLPGFQFVITGIVE